MRIEVIGEIDEIGPEQVFGKFKKKSVRFKTSSDPVEYLCCDLWERDYGIMQAVSVGDYVAADVDATAREAKDHRWWNALRLVAINKIPGVVSDEPEQVPDGADADEGTGANIAPF